MTALDETLARFLAPLARLCLANGVTYSLVTEKLKHAFVQEAQAHQAGASSQRAVSRISTATGISRREVKRLTESGQPPARSAKPPYATQLFARWTTDSAFRDENGELCMLKRLGPAPSFESLATSVTRDVHPRSLLEELNRLGIATYDEEQDRVILVRSEFVPDGDTRQMLGFLADNVGDHFSAAVANVAKSEHWHFEQAVFADELSAESIEALRPVVAAQWQALRDAMVPALTSLIETDSVAGRVQDRRVRIGLYSYTEIMPDAEAPDTASCPSENLPIGAHK